ncbi:leucyl aminopeptidase [Verrucomicrobium sp. GAS474]|uniref:leucyl aminopeptidase n=1 Tax=Verrucomicrobium sp. GAS474 TaxID=1882831 RepID=UPI00087A26D2|nr:leucyl aminopeptidase [Verrucomicrobium sp. GAS474]SDU21906.1 leucyl aminopeptidase [Verrucomicrobium sp. GAS474]
MKLEVLAQAPASSKADLLRFAPRGSRPVADVKPAEFDGLASTSLLHREGARRVLYVGIGASASVTPDLLRRAAGSGAKSLLKIGAEEILVDATGHEAHVGPIVEGIFLAAYKFEAFKAPAARRKTILKSLRVVVAPAHLAAAKKEAEASRHIAEATNIVREIGNLPGNEITPIVLADIAKELARTHHLKYTVWDEKRLEKEGFGGILAVGKGSANPPRLISLEYEGGARKDAPVVIVGKAITFDSGGISIKPSDRMDEMKFDKMGGCAVLGILRAVADLKLPINVVGLITSAENMPGSRAYRPGDIVTTYSGQTIEVLNTDAEGRIVLADALAYAVAKHKPRLLFDLATLTGACVVALGGSRAGLFTSDPALRQALWERSEAAGDPVWPLPMGDEYADQIKSDVALVKNTGGREGGASTAASFLQHWAGETPWVHLDIAGPAWITKELPYLEKGATGFGVRLLVDFLRKKK